ncbi:MAG TPA: PadR family transcriptional regulator [Blastocatellia bacterium]|nr:PadR family transcriptional regulator [Blastocatellia bacterium]
MSPKAYLSYTASVILQAVANSYRYGFDIMDITGLPSGTVYPALRRLEEMSLIASKWEDQSVAQKQQRPARKYYEVTRSGKEALAEAVNRYRFLDRLVPQASRKLKPSRGRG